MIIGVLIVISALVMLWSNFSPFTWTDEISGIRQGHLIALRGTLDVYHIYNSHFPTSLSDLEIFIKERNPEAEIPKDPKTNKDYLYASYPSDKPTAYHLGAVLENKRATMLRSDSDFNSKAAGYVNGFDGKDPVYDIRVSK